MCIFLAVSSTTGLYGQKSGGKIKISGIVTDLSGNPVADAVILVDGEKTGNLTDRKGFYKIKVRQDNKKIGILTSSNTITEEAIDGRNNISFNLKESIPYVNKGSANDEKVNVGYGVMKKSEVVGSVGRIDGKRSRYAGYNTIYEMIRGEVPGVQVTGTSIMIRSATSIAAGTEPMFVVDGVPVTTIDNISPQLVKSIDVLKGSAAAIYGSRGSNGVIIISLLKGNDK